MYMAFPKYIKVKKSMKQYNNSNLNIVAGRSSCPTSRISHIVDILNKPLQEVAKSYIRDDIDFHSKHLER